MRLNNFRALSTSLLLSAQIVMIPAIPLAEEILIDVKSASPVRTSLEKLQGKQVSLRVVNGEEMTGMVVAVGSDAVHLGKLSGREYFDAVVPFDKIVAVIVRTK